MSQDTVLAEIQASGARRIFAVGAQGVLGVLLIYLAIANPPSGFGYIVFLLVAGVFSLISAQRLWRATATGLRLTTSALSDMNGTVLAKTADMTKVDRGLFAFKPSNGFMVHLAHRHPRKWAPGMWWCTGKRIGVGGVVPAGQSKFMAEQIELLLVKRAP
ncbi:hypothetical protein [Algirhabdus cladophorae]|uniref:hypothetical protein n=1 Tax=Algirhabdus cladophorae TaxID=3377108 RepID=UPI003B84AD54